jgi:hypothetical protein
LQDKANKKNIKHAQPYRTLGYTFVPCVASTYGQLHGDFLRVLYLLARQRAEAVIKHHRPDADFDLLLGQYFAAGRARLGVSIARGMAMRALSISLHGVRRPRPFAIRHAAHLDQHLERDANPHTDLDGVFDMFA